MTELPWDDCKVAFGIEDGDAVWDVCGGNGKHADLPAGWSLNETDGSGARLVVVFRVEGVAPTAEDGAKVLAFLQRIGAMN